MGPGRPRRDHADVERRRATAPSPGATATGWCGSRAATPSSPAAPLSGLGRAAGPTRRPGRDLERDAVLLAPLGPLPEDRVPPPRPRRDVADGDVADAWPRSAPSSSAGWRRPSTAGAGSSPCRRRRATRSSPCSGSARRADQRRPPRRRSPVQPRGAAVARAAGGGRRPAGAGEAFRPAHRRAGGRAPATSPDCGPRSWARATNGPPGGEDPGRRRRRWIELVGRLSEDELLDVYRRAWVLVSTSQREGWGMTITEAAACGTPAVVTRIAGHSDAVVHGVTGILVDTPEPVRRCPRGRAPRRHATRRRLGGPPWSTPAA